MPITNKIRATPDCPPTPLGSAGPARTRRPHRHRRLPSGCSGVRTCMAATPLRRRPADILPRRRCHRRPQPSCQALPAPPLPSLPAVPVGSSTSGCGTGASGLTSQTVSACAPLPHRRPASTTVLCRRRRRCHRWIHRHWSHLTPAPPLPPLPRNNPPVPPSPS